MPFDDFQKHCTECKKSEPCGKYHLYVMKLDHKIYEGKKKFRLFNPDCDRNKDFYYIGMTKHHPRCRQSQHQSYNPNNPNNTWICYCNESPGKNSYGFTNKPSKFIQGYTDGHLLREQLDPFDDKLSAEKGERLLGLKYREKGFGVWRGHHEKTLYDVIKIFNKEYPDIDWNDDVFFQEVHFAEKLNAEIFQCLDHILDTDYDLQSINIDEGKMNIGLQIIGDGINWPALRRYGLSNTMGVQSVEDKWCRKLLGVPSDIVVD